ncbi:hypothetical protein LB456_09040 [Psychroflexus sp. CAK57W]|uniref:hypothetical protein n=1 Tax=Psychroflexus curvus TaxID=2873595 RepID=UPI001CCACA75|nr:hypothetical protein [Psychroflexus curvus]MBZ9787599.1 hypothetical protein [Psychroflexus curvus]
MSQTYFIPILTDININELIFSWYGLEIIIIVLVILYQLYHTINLYFKINKLKNIFCKELFIKNGFLEKEKIGKVGVTDFKEIYFEDDIDLDENSMKEISNDNVIKLSLVESKGQNNIIKDIKYGINTYLINNYGAVVNFSIIKDIIDREIEVKDEEVLQSISLPLYLGLSATMIGIIFGLFSMPSLDDEGFTLAINALIGGVKIAMIGSLFGLVCTTFLSSFVYKSAKRKLQKQKNDQITYLQAKLLPELLKAEDTGVSGLKASLDRFARLATNISESVMNSATKTEKNLQLQNELMVKVNNMDALKVSKFNLELFNKIDKNMDAFKDFSTYLSSLNKMTNQLEKFADRTSDIDNVVSNIDLNLEQSKEFSKFLTSHFEKIENSGESALKAVGIAETHFEKAILALNKRTEEMLENLYQSSGNHEVKLEKIYSDINDNLNQIASEYVNQLRNTFDNSKLNFEKLENLEYLDQINSSIIKIEENKFLMDKLSSIESKLESQGINQSVLRKLDTIEIEAKKSSKIIEDASNKITNRSPGNKPTTVPKENELKKTNQKQEKVSLKKVLNKVFKK